MTTPARHLAQALSLADETAITQVHRAANRRRCADTERLLNIGCTGELDLGAGPCGDWPNGGKVEGAWLSGGAPAQLVLQWFGSR